MIEKIISNYAPKLSSFTAAAKNYCSNSSIVSKYKDAIKQYLTIVDSRQAISDAFISAFASNPELFCNKVAGQSVLDTEQDYSYTIGQDSVDLLLSMFENDGLANTLTFTDSNGNPYTFMLNSNVVDGYTSVISSQTHPTSTRDLVLYMDEQGKYYFNPVIRIAEYYDGEVIAAVTVSQIYEAVDLFCVIANVSPDHADILNSLIALNNVLEFTDLDSHTINWYVSKLMLAAGLTYSGQLSDLAHNFRTIAVYIMEQLSIRRVKSTGIYGLVQDLVINNELIDVIRTVYDNIVNGDLSQFITYIKTYIESKTETVKTFGRQVMLGFARNGIVGALGAIVDLLKKVFESEPSGYSVFDTKGSVPQAFSAGFISIATGIATTLFQLISGAMHPVIAIIGTIGYGIFSTIGQVINANVSEEYARVDDLTLCENTAPYAINGISIDLTTSSGENFINLNVINDDKRYVTLKELLDWTTKDGNPLLTIEWYGVVIKLAYADPILDDDGELRATTLVVNVFPTVCDTETLIFDSIAESHIMSYLTTPSSVDLDGAGTGKLYYNHWNSILSSLSSYIFGMITSKRNSVIDFTPKVINDNSGTYAGYMYADDSKCKRQVYKNILLFFALVQYNTGVNLFLQYHEGNNYVKVELINLVPCIKLSGQEIPFIDVIFGCLCHGTKSFGTFDGHHIWLVDASSSYESLAKTCLSMQDNQSVLFTTSMVKSLFVERDTLKNYPNSNRPVISTRSTYRDIPYFIPPKYTRGSVITSIVIGALVAITTAVAVAVTVLSVKRKINKQRAMKQAAVENAWSNLTKDPSAENYEIYRSTVRANNRFSRVFGGTKYDYVNYWNGDTSDPKSATSAFETITSYFEGDPETTTDLPVDSIASVIKLLNGAYIGE